MTARLYLEGGGDSKDMHARCRRGFRLLLEQAGFSGRMPRLIASGGRSAVYDDFCTAHADATGSFVAMLVDSEDPVTDGEEPWAHLFSRDKWRQPNGAVAEQALLMVTCMETWIASDPAALRARFGKGFRRSALPPLNGLEGRRRKEVLTALEHATRTCSAQYKKGPISFEVLGMLSPAVLQALPAFARMLRVLQARL